MHNPKYCLFYDNRAPRIVLMPGREKNLILKKLPMDT